MVEVFVSHSSSDADLAKAVVNLIRAALLLPASAIRCTSVDGYKLPGGARTSTQLRQELLVAPVFIGLVTERSAASTYVLFELGARWGAERPLIPLLGPEMSAGALDDPLSELSALSCRSAADLHTLVSQIADALGKTVEPAAAYHAEIEAIRAIPAPSRSDGTVTQAAVDQLAELRSDAVHEILNRPVRNNADLAKLQAYVEAWWNSVKAVLEANFSKAEQLNFTRLGSVPVVQFAHTYNEVHAKILREYALQERRLLDIIARHTR